MVSSVYHVNRMLTFRVFHERGNFCLVLCDRVVFPVLLDVPSVGKFENLQIFYFFLRFVLSLIDSVRFNSLEG